MVYLQCIMIATHQAILKSRLRNISHRFKAINKKEPSPARHSGEGGIKEVNYGPKSVSTPVFRPNMQLLEN